MPAPDRAGPATLISSGDGPDAEHYLVDAGRGVLMRLAACGLGAPSEGAEKVDRRRIGEVTAHRHIGKQQVPLDHRRAQCLPAPRQFVRLDVELRTIDGGWSLERLGAQARWVE